MEHLLQKSKCSIFHNIFKYMIFQSSMGLWVKSFSNQAKSSNRKKKFTKVFLSGVMAIRTLHGKNGGHPRVIHEKFGGNST